MQVDAALEKAGIDFEAPTFILSECVLVYMQPNESEALLKSLASRFSTSVIVVRTSLYFSLLTCSLATL